MAVSAVAHERDLSGADRAPVIAHSGEKSACRRRYWGQPGSSPTEPVDTGYGSSQRGRAATAQDRSGENNEPFREIV